MPLSAQSTGKATPTLDPGERLECCSNIAHYVRQITISRRRQVPWINRSWNRSRDITTLRKTWTR